MKKISDLSERFLLVLKKIGVSGYQLSKQIPEISQSSLTHIRNGRNEPSKIVLDLLLKRYPEINAVWLLTGEGDALNTSVKSTSTGEANKLSDIQFLNIPFVPIHAQAGYGKGYGDQEYIESLPTIPVIVDKTYRGKYRVFEVKGDSMDDGSRKALCEGDKILCREVKQELWQNKLHFKDWFFVICMRDNGVLVKQITAHDVESGMINCHSLNTLFEDFEVNLREVAELYNVIKIVDRNTRI